MKASTSGPAPGALVTLAGVSVPPGSNALTQNPHRPVFGGENLRQPDQPRLAGGVGGHARHAHRVADEGGGQDQRAAAAFDHRRHLILGAQKSARQIGVERLAPTLQRQTGNGSHLADDAGIVEGDIEPSEFACSQFDQGLRIGFVLDVTGKGRRLTIGLPDLRDERVELCLAPGGDDDPGALSREQQRGRPANSGTGPGHNGDFSDEGQSSRIPFSCSDDEDLEKLTAGHTPSLAFS